jgi:hypothetical protein
MVMKSAENRNRCYAAYVLDGGWIGVSSGRKVALRPRRQYGGHTRDGSIRSIFRRSRSAKASLGQRACGISRLALEVWNSRCPNKAGRMQAFTQHRIRIERVASAKFDRGQLEPDGSTVRVRAADLSDKCSQPTRDGSAAALAWCRHSEISPNVLYPLKSNRRDFSECVLMDNANQVDFDSAIRRFESSRPSQPVRL